MFISFKNCSHTPYQGTLNETISQLSNSGVLDKAPEMFSTETTHTVDKVHKIILLIVFALILLLAMVAGAGIASCIGVIIYSRKGRRAENLSIVHVDGTRDLEQGVRDRTRTRLNGTSVAQVETALQHPPAVATDTV